jgi:hypothetical protein
VVRISFRKISQIEAILPMGSCMTQS